MNFYKFNYPSTGATGESVESLKFKNFSKIFVNLIIFRIIAFCNTSEAVF